MVQLPDDVTAKGYKETRPFLYEQVFYSPSKDFTGTEKEFLSAGHAYEYTQIDAYKRVVIR